MKHHWKSILMLMTSSVTFTELLTGNVALPELLNPIVCVFLLTIAYGFPVLLIRESHVRWRSGLAGLLFLGLAYGVWNEGVLAKTLLMNANVPIDTFDGCAGWLGINAAWGSMIIPWHAFHAVIYPIVLVQYLRANDSEVQWLSRRQFRWIAGVTFSLGTLFFFVNRKNAVGDMRQFIVFTLLMAGLIFTAYQTRGYLHISLIQVKARKTMMIFGGIFVILLIIGSSVVMRITNPPATILFCLALTAAFVWRFT